MENVLIWIRAYKYSPECVNNCDIKYIRALINFIWSLTAGNSWTSYYSDSIERTLEIIINIMRILRIFYRINKVLWHFKYMCVYWVWSLNSRNISKCHYIVLSVNKSRARKRLYKIIYISYNQHASLLFFIT